MGYGSAVSQCWEQFRIEVFELLKEEPGLEIERKLWKVTFF